MFMVVSQAASGKASNFPGTIFMALLTRISIRPRSVDDGIDHPGDIGGLGDVADETKTTNVLGGRRRGRRIDVVDDDLGALAGISERDVAADAAPCPGDQRHFVLQPHGILP